MAVAGNYESTQSPSCFSCLLVEVDVQKAQLISDAGAHKRKVPVEFEQENLWQKSLEAPANGGERGKGDMLQECV